MGDRHLLFHKFIYPLLLFYQRTIFCSVFTTIIGYHIMDDKFLNIVKFFIFGLFPIADNNNISWNVYLSCLNSTFFAKSYSSYLIAFRIGAGISVMLHVIELIWAPFTIWISKIHKEVKEEKYTYRVLKNHPDKEGLTVRVTVTDSLP